MKKIIYIFFISLLTLTNAFDDFSKILSLSTAKRISDSGITFNDLNSSIADVNITARCEELPTITLTNLCRNQMEIVCENETLLMTFYDASSKIPYPGLAYATRMDLGNFDQCLTVNHEENNNRILGKFCANSIVIPTTTNGTYLEIILAAYKFSTCIPDQCTAEDVGRFLDVPEYLFPFINDEICTTIETDTQVTAGDIIVAIIFLVVVNLMIICTVYDRLLERRELKPKSLIFVAFSVLSNGRKLLQTTDQSKEQILIFNGLKFISMLWILAGHNFGMLNVAPFSNDEDATTFLSKRYSQYISAAYIAVDTFFFISGFLIAYQYLKQKPKPFMVQLMKVPYMYVHRYLRLTPALLMVYLFYITLFNHIGFGPLSHVGREYVQTRCTDNWWSFFLYIQNYYNPDELCLTHTWYLSADMQMFLLAPIVLIPLSLEIKRNFKISMIKLLVLNIFVTILPIVLKLAVRSYDNQYDTHSRLVDYFIGIMFGAYLRERKEKPYAFSKTVSRIIWVVVLGGMIAIFLCHQEVKLYHGFVSQVFYDGFYRPAWCICLCWITYSCYHGEGGFVSWLLSCTLFQVGSKLTYCMYLVHGSVIVLYFIRIQNRIYFSDYDAFYIFCGQLMITMLVATFWTLAFESPLIIVEKMIFGTAQPRSRPPPSKEAPKEKARINEGTYKIKPDII